MLTDRDFVNGVLLDQSAALNAGGTPDLNETLTSPVSRRGELMKHFEIVVDEAAGAVRLNLGQTAPIDFIRAAGEISLELHSRRAVGDLTLDRWSRNPDFKAPLGASGALHIQGAAPESLNMSRTEQTNAGLNNVTPAELAAAHAAYFLATGEDIFKNLHVRASQGVLRFFRDGVHHYSDDFIDAGFHDVAASKKL